MDITPQVPEGLQIIHSYGERGFNVSGERHEGSLIVMPECVVDWPVTHVDAITMESLAAVLSAEPRIELLLIGCGTRHTMVAPDLRKALREAGIAVEGMDTGAACRTYNVLLAEERRVAAALISIAAA
jgi:uncharacterized protein